MPTETAEEESGHFTARGELRAHLIVVMEAARPLARGARYSLAAVDQVLVGRGSKRSATRRVEQGAGKGLNVLDVKLPSQSISSDHARITRVGAVWSIDDAGSRNGTRLNGERISTAVLREGDILEIGGAFLMLRAAWLTDTSQPPDLDAESRLQTNGLAGLRSLDPFLARHEAEIRRVARARIPVVVLGETGTGKEVIARMMHAASGRRGDFVAVNCGALPTELVEASLFGHAKGSYSGAVRDEPGFVRSSNAGTLFLDEIGDLPLAAQAALLRVLQESEVVAVGTTKPIKVDLRVIAATHRRLDDMVADGTFRGDLLARLAGYRVNLAPLRERKEDIGILIGDLLERVAGGRATKLSFTARAARALLIAEWPDNIRGLEHVLSRAVTVCTDDVLRPEHLPKEMEAERGGESVIPPPDLSSPEGRSPMVDIKSEALRTALTAQLKTHHGNVAAVARDMAKAPMQIRRWMKFWGIDPDSFRK